MIYITSDIHIPIDVKKINTSSFSKRFSVTSADKLLICGDFGGVWDGSGSERYWLNWLNQRPYTTLFIDGNHENHARLASDFPEIDYCGGRAHRISDRIYHLMRGYVFELENHRVFTMGGAASHDRANRQEGIDWWPEELPSEREYERAEKNLEICGWKVDYVITHCAPEHIQRMCFPTYESNALTVFLEAISKRLLWRHWYFGHYHTDCRINDRYICLFESVLPLGSENNVFRLREAASPTYRIRETLI